MAWAVDHGAAAAAAKFRMSVRSVLRWTAAGVRKTERVTTTAARPSEPQPGRELESAGARRARHGRRFSVAEKKAILDHAEAHGVSAAAAQFATSRWSIYDWPAAAA